MLENQSGAVDFGATLQSTAFLSRGVPVRPDASAKPAAAPRANGARVVTLRPRETRSYTLSDTVDAYLAAYTGRDPALQSTLAMWVERMGDMNLEQITGDHVAAVLEEMAASPILRYSGRHPDTGEPVYRSQGLRAPATINRYKSVLGTIYGYAKKRKLLPQSFMSPTRMVASLEVDNVRDRSFSEDEQRALLAQAKIAPWEKMYLYVLMALATGARRGELLQLRGSDLDLKRMPATATARLTKNGDVKTMVLSQQVVDEIRRSGAPQPGALLFESKKKPGQPFTINKPFQRLLAACGLEGHRLHDLRHTTGTVLARSGKKDHEISAILGHRGLEMARRYAHHNVDSKADVIQSSPLVRLG
ncbi:site-specific integrase [Variovorax sp. J22R115]|uniref:tyrosine-type recombinase/integrase n=1 Tax=Variovorax sp. J22R115 TaxID=3053509 RepID=UPI0025760AAB|nr:site-specific integrase [Variovorax sp. J22R115]MDM0050919.1 site-specific integrase [Variovorax sp. J22R115]